jgi:hypothetical protein
LAGEQGSSLILSKPPLDFDSYRPEFTSIFRRLETSLDALGVKVGFRSRKKQKPPLRIAPAAGGL